MDRGLVLGLRSYLAVKPMSRSVALDAAGRRRSPATTRGFHAGRPPRNKGLRYPADRPTAIAALLAPGSGWSGIPVGPAER
jgi:hypothetical protein